MIPFLLLNLLLQQYFLVHVPTLNTKAPTSNFVPLLEVPTKNVNTAIIDKDKARETLLDLEQATKGKTMNSDGLKKPSSKKKKKKKKKAIVLFKR